jgi:hypothetical protein
MREKQMKISPATDANKHRRRGGENWGIISCRREAYADKKSDRMNRRERK